jgi:hypothetical protein
MKQILLTAILLIPFFMGNAQVKKQKNKHPNFIEIYYADKKTGMMEGNYRAEVPGLTTCLAEGNYANGLRKGIWVYNNPVTSQKVLEYDYDNDSLLYYDPAWYPNFFLINNGEKFDVFLVERPFIFLGFQNEMLMDIAENVKLPKRAKNGESGISFIGYTVDESGNIVGSKVVESFDEQSEQQINTIVNKFNGRILPPVFQGKPVKSVFYVKVNWNAFSLSEQLPYIYEVNMNIENNINNYYNGSGNPGIRPLQGALENQYQYRYNNDAVPRGF